MRGDRKPRQSRNRYPDEPQGLWTDAPASNLLDGAAPFYRCYRCADGRDVAVGCLEPRFFAQMVKGLGLEDRDYRQDDRADWPRMVSDFSACFAIRPRDEWAALFAPTDACVTPVLSMAEAPAHPHNPACAGATLLAHGRRDGRARDADHRSRAGTLGRSNDVVRPAERRAAQK